MFFHRRNFAIFRLNRIIRLVIFILSLVILYYIWSSNSNSGNIVKIIDQNDNKINRNKKIGEIRSNNAICIVLTAEKSITTRGVGIWDTWGPSN